MVSKVATVVRPVLDVMEAHMHLDKFMQDTGWYVSQPHKLITHFT